MLTFNVSQLLSKHEGAVEKYTLDEAVKYPAEDYVKLTSHVTGTVQFLKLAHEINVQLTDIHTSYESECSRCLKTFSLAIDIPFAEREFSIDLGRHEIEPGEDVYLVDPRAHEISLLEILRQEILLHAQAMPICSEHCNGLCNQCGTNLNEKKCTCVRKTTKYAGKPWFTIK